MFTKYYVTIHVVMLYSICHVILKVNIYKYGCQYTNLPLPLHIYTH